MSLKRGPGFAKGHRKVGGRRKGRVNKATAEIRRWFIDAAAAIGSDGKGKGGGQGFVERAGRNNDTALLMALARLLPPPPKDEPAIPSIGVVNIVSEPNGKFLSAEDVRATIEADYEVIEKSKDEDDAA